MSAPSCNEDERWELTHAVQLGVSETAWNLKRWNMAKAFPKRSSLRYLGWMVYRKSWTNADSYQIFVLYLSWQKQQQQQKTFIPIYNYLIADKIIALIATLLLSPPENQCSSQGESWRGEESFAFSEVLPIII